MTAGARTGRTFALGFASGVAVASLVALLWSGSAEPVVAPPTRAGAATEDAPATASGRPSRGPTAQPRRARAATEPEATSEAPTEAEEPPEAFEETGEILVDVERPRPDCAGAVAFLEAIVTEVAAKPGAELPRDPAKLLASSDGADAMRAVGLAVIRGSTDTLLVAAAPTESTPVRRAAIVGLGRTPWDGERSAAALRTAWDGGDDDLRAAVLGAISLLPDDAAAGLAREILRRGDASGAELALLAEAALRSGDPAATIREAHDAETALALAVALRANEGWADRWMGPEGDPVCDAITPWLRGEGLVEERAAASLFFPQSRRWQRFAQNLGDPGISPAVREAMLLQAIAMEDVEPTVYEGAVAAFLSDRSVRAAHVVSVLDAMTPAHLGTPSVRAALESLADDARDSERREAARQALQRLRPGDTADLQIVRAEYGDGTTWRDVTAAVRSLCVRGRLAMQVMNDIDGDPLEGVVKALRVEYIHRGRRFSVSAGEYDWIRIP